MSLPFSARRTYSMVYVLRIRTSSAETDEPIDTWRWGDGADLYGPKELHVIDWGPDSSGIMCWPIVTVASMRRRCGFFTKITWSIQLLMFKKSGLLSNIDDLRDLNSVASSSVSFNR